MHGGTVYPRRVVREVRPSRLQETDPRPAPRMCIAYHLTPHRGRRMDSVGRFGREGRRDVKSGAKEELSAAAEIPDAPG